MILFQLNSIVWAVFVDEENIWFNLRGVEKFFDDFILPETIETTSWMNLRGNFHSKHHNMFKKETVFIPKQIIDFTVWINEIMEVYEVLKTEKHYFRFVTPELYLCYYDDEGKITNFYVFLNSFNLVWFEAKKISSLLDYKNFDRFSKTYSSLSWFQLSEGSKLLPENTRFVIEHDLFELLVKATRKHTSFQFKLWILRDALPYLHSLNRHLEEPPAKKAKIENGDLEATLKEIKYSLNEIKRNNDEIVNFYNYKNKFKTEDLFENFSKETNTYTNIQQPFTLFVFRLSENEFKVAINYKQHIKVVLDRIKKEIPHAILIYLKSNIFNTLPFIATFFIVELKKLVPLSKVVKDTIFVECNIPQLTEAFDKVVNDLRNM